MVLNHLDGFLLAGEPPAIVTLALQDAPKFLHRAIVNTVGHTGHTLRHSGLLKFMVECPAGVLKAPVTME